MLHREPFESDYARLYTDFGMGTTIWSPLASGLLTGKYNNGIPNNSRIALEGYEWLREMFESDAGRQKVEKVKQLVPIADELECSMAKLALAWCLKNPNVSAVITGASKPEQVVENMAALDVAEKLTPAIMERIETILDNKPQPVQDFR